MRTWGRCLHLRRVCRPASGSAGPKERFNGLSPPGLDGIGEDIALDAAELLSISYQAIITFILPKRVASSSQRLVDLPGAITFQMNRSESGGIEQSVHRDEGSPGRQAFYRELAACRQAAMKAKGDEERLSDSVDVRQTAL
jgi:hypothetical protein